MALGGEGVVNWEKSATARAMFFLFCFFGGGGCGLKANDCQNLNVTHGSSQIHMEMGLLLRLYVQRGSVL